MQHKLNFSWRQITRQSLFIALMAILVVSNIGANPGLVNAQDPDDVTVEEKTAEIVAAANSLLDILDDDQYADVLFEYEDEDQRNNWSNLPSGLYTRSGISVGTMTDEQREAVLVLLETALSEDGYQKLIDAMIGDEILLQTSTGMGGGSTIFGYGEYYLSFVGAPSETDPWILQFGGHHFAINLTFVGTQSTMAPSHTGCQPCTYIYNDREVRVLGDEYALALELINSLEGDAQDQAILDYSVTNLVLGPGEEDRVLEAEGLPASEMTEEQQEILMSLIAEWVNISNDVSASARLEAIRADLPETYFAWSGDIDEDSTSYFRITGPTVLIEFAPQGNGGGGQGGPPSDGGTPPDGGGAPGGNTDGESATASGFQLDLGEFEVLQDGELYHIHTIYRNPTNPYGTGFGSE